MHPYSTGTKHGTHVDGIQFHRGRNYTFVGNLIGGTRVPGTLYATPTQKGQMNRGDDMGNAALMIKQEVDNTPANRLENVLIDRNWLVGGTSTVNIVYNHGNRLDSVRLTNNRFPRSTWGQQYYVMRQKDPSGVPVGVFSNNVMDDDGAPVTISNGGTATGP